MAELSGKYNLGRLHTHGLTVILLSCLNPYFLQNSSNNSADKNDGTKKMWKNKHFFHQRNISGLLTASGTDINYYYVVAENSLIISLFSSFDRNKIE